MLIRPCGPNVARPSVYGGGRVTGAAEPDPTLSLFNAGPSARGQRAVPSSLTLNGSSIGTKLWVGRDYSSGAGTWAEHHSGAAGDLLSESGTPGSVLPAITSAGGNGDKRLVGNSSWYLSKSGTVCDPGTNDWLTMWLAASTAATDILWGTRNAGANDGFLHYRNGTSQRQVFLHDGSGSLIYTPHSTSWNSHISHAAICDRSHASGLVGYIGDVQATAGNPSTVSGHIGDGSGLGLLANVTGLLPMAGSFELFLYGDCGTSLDAASLQSWVDAHRRVMAYLCGAQLTTYQGSDDWPIVENNGRAYNIDGTSLSHWGQGFHPLESSDGAAGNLYHQMQSTYLEYLNLDAEVPPTANGWSFRTWFRKDGAPASAMPLLSVGLNAGDRFEVSLTSSGYIDALVNSTAGDNGSVTGSVNLCDNAKHKLEVSLEPNALVLRIDGVEVGRDTSVTYPASNTIFRVGANYDLSAYSDWDLMAAEDGGALTGGFHAWDQALWA